MSRFAFIERVEADALRGTEVDGVRRNPHALSRDLIKMHNLIKHRYLPDV